MKEDIESEILELIQSKQNSSSKEIFDGLGQPPSYATVKRILSKLLHENFLIRKGNGKSTKYLISPTYELLYPMDMVKYYEKEIDDRKIREAFNFDLISDTLVACKIFTLEEIQELEALQQKFNQNIAALSTFEYSKELERLAIDLSWKSSQIEGNTYSLLETERLLKEKKTASGKTKEEAIMLLNHKQAIDFIVEHTDYLSALSVSKIEDIHSILMKELGVDKNIRRRRVGISGTNYRPLDNEYQIKEALQSMCTLINNKESIFEKALLALVLISYIQPFVDGNKRTGRIVSNAILMNYKYCPISFRTIDATDYKKAILIFYEQNNIYNFKKIFIDQFRFAVNTYF